MTQEDYVTYEQAIRLKELGFDWKCEHYYVDETKTWKYLVSNHKVPYVISCPTLSLVAKWLRKEGLFIDVWRNESGYNWDIDYNYVAIECESTKKFDTYEKALSNAIDKALEILKTK